MRRCSIENYRNVIFENTGKNIILNIKRGRKQITINNCIIEDAYEHIFTVRIIGESLIKCDHISICYADLITGNARVTIPKLSKEA